MTAIFELFEWAVAERVGGELGMALASLGALIAMSVAMAVNMALQRDFAPQFRDSLRVKRAEPLRETKIGRMWRGEE